MGRPCVDQVLDIIGTLLYQTDYCRIELDPFLVHVQVHQLKISEVVQALELWEKLGLLAVGSSHIYLTDEGMEVVISDFF